MGLLGTTMMAISYWGILMFFRNPLSLQVKRSAIISNKHIYIRVASWVAERLITLWTEQFYEIRENQEDPKTSLNHSIAPSLTTKMKTLPVPQNNCAI